MIVVTFYSFKGGVGRSMALANVAELLAAKGRNVVVCDFDLEAPGIERFAVDDYDTALAMRTWPGVMDLLVEYKQAMTHTSPRASEAAVEQSPAFAEIGGGLRLRRPSACANLVREYPSSGGQLRVLTAGRRDGDHQGNYASAVQALDWNDFYENWEGAAYLNFFRRDLASSGADVLLIDSRTGVTEQSGVCTHDLADAVVLFCAASDQSLSGTQWMVEMLSRPELVTARGGRSLDLLVMPARVDQRAEVTQLGEFRTRFAERFDRYGERWGLGHVSSENREIPYIAHYAFQERVVSRDPEVSQRGAEGMLQAYRLLSDCVDRRVVGPLPVFDSPQRSLPPVLELEPPDRANSRAVDVVNLRFLLDAAEGRATSLTHDLAVAQARTADAIRRADEGKARAEDLERRVVALTADATGAVHEVRLAMRRRIAQLLVTTAVVVTLSSIALVLQRQEVVTLRSGLNDQLRSATQGLSDQARAAKKEALDAKIAADRAEKQSVRTEERALKLYEEALAAKKSEDDFRAAAKRADEAKLQAVHARVAADAANVALVQADREASEAAALASDARRYAAEALADRDVARQALVSERAALAQVETKLAVQANLVQQVQQSLALCQSNLYVCRQPVVNEITGDGTE